MSGKTIPCPYCGASWEAPSVASMQQRRVPFTKDIGRNIETKGIFGRSRASEDIQRSNEKLDIPCPACKNIFRYDARTGQASR